MLTEPVSGSTPFESSSEVSEGSSQAHTCCCVDVHGRNPRVDGADLGARRTCSTRERSQPTNADVEGTRWTLQDFFLRGLVSDDTFVRRGRDDTLA